MSTLQLANLKTICYLCRIGKHIQLKPVDKMKKKFITACVMPFLAACGQNNSDIFTINDGRIDGLHAPWDGLDDDTKFRCSTDDSLFKFSFEVNDSTLTLEPEYKDKMSVIYEDRVDIFGHSDVTLLWSRNGSCRQSA